MVKQKIKRLKNTRLSDASENTKQQKTADYSERVDAAQSPKKERK